MMSRHLMVLGVALFACGSLAGCAEETHTLSLEGRTFTLGTPVLLDLEGETLLLWMNVDDNCAATFSNEYNTPEGEDLVIMRYWGLPRPAGRLDGLALSADVFLDDADIDPSFTYSSNGPSDFIEVSPGSGDASVLKFQLTFVAVTELEVTRILDEPVIFEGEQVATTCP